MKDKSGEEAKQSGYYFPITAAQRFSLDSAPNGTLANAVYIPHVAALQFTGDYTMSKARALQSRIVRGTLVSAQQLVCVADIYKQSGGR